MAFTSRSVNLSWTPPLNTHNSPILHYVIHVRVGEEGDWNEKDSVETPHNATVYQVDKLQPFTTYSFRVTAVNAVGKSHHSKESYYMLTLREGKVRSHANFSRNDEFKKPAQNIICFRTKRKQEFPVNPFSKLFSI